jgi:hypothetical protein
MSVFSHSQDMPSRGKFEMSAVIYFTNKLRQTKSDEVFFGPAQVIIFPGVRFERLIDVDSDVEFKPTRAARVVHRSNQATAEDLQ